MLYLFRTVVEDTQYLNLARYKFGMTHFRQAAQPEISEGILEAKEEASHSFL